MKVVFLLPVAGHARYHKRIEALQNLGVEPEILAFERDYYAGKAWSGGYKSLGKLQHGHYCKRLIPLLKAVPKVRAAVKEADIIYAFDLDVLLVGWLASQAFGKRRKIVYEVGDLGVLTRDGLFYRGLRLLERYLLQRIDLLVVTSEAYIEGYYRRVQRLTDLPHQVIENKLDATTVTRPQVQSIRNKRDESLRIGYFGLIRCRRSWEALKRAAIRGNGRIQVYVRGKPMRLEGFEEEARSAPYVHYGGPYISPDDLPAMYGQVDVVWIAHYMSKNSLLWNRANRFYEACFFQKPMIAQIGTQDAQVVKDLGLGVCVDLRDINGTVDRILSISKMELSRWHWSIAHLPAYIYTYTDEHKELARYLKGM
jgi:succinoglycan biosynthesis protein ExoL